MYPKKYRSFKESALRASVSFFIVLFAAPSNATPTCNAGTYKGTSGYRINSTTAGVISGISATEFYRAVAQSANEWNEHGHTRTFKYLGSTTESDLPEYEAACGFSGCCEYSIVRIVDGYNGGLLGANSPVCKDTSGVAQQFTVTIYRYSSAGNPWPWVIGSVASSYDLLQTLTHEFGHTTKLHHPSTEAAVMRTTGNSVGLTRQRNVYEYDTYCQHEYESEYDLLRALTGQKTTFSSGSFSVLSTFTGTQPIRRATAGSTWHNSAWSYSSSFPVSGVTPKWTRDLDTSNTVSLTAITELDDIGLVDAVWRDRDPNMQRVFYSSYTDSGTSFSAVHRVKYLRSSNEFSTSAGGLLYECPSHFTPTSCSADRFNTISSGNPVGVAWMPGPTGPNGVGVTVMAWTQQTRTDTTSDRQVRISFGSTAENVVARSDSAGVQSKIGPGVACKTYSSGAPATYNCLLAYVSQDDNTNTLRVKRFRHDVFLDRYALGISSGYYTLPFPTSSRVALFYSGGKYYLAARSDAAAQPTYIYSSSDDGATWTYVAFFSGAAVGPSSASYRDDATSPGNAIVAGME